MRFQIIGILQNMPLLGNDTGAAISYTPYLSKLVNDIFLADVTYYQGN